MTGKIKDRNPWKIEWYLLIFTCKGNRKRKESPTEPLEELERKNLQLEMEKLKEETKKNESRDKKDRTGNRSSTVTKGIL